jgi:hypothetical protein
MKIKELIQELQKFNPEDLVLTTYSGIEICDISIKHGKSSISNNAFYTDDFLEIAKEKNLPNDLISTIFLGPKNKQI